jgi:5'-3' exonuclease
LAILLGSGVKGTNVQKLSNTIIKKFGNNFLNTSIQDLISISGIGKVKAMQIISAIALVKRIYAEQEGDDFIVKNIQDVLTLTHNLKDKKKEYLVEVFRKLLPNFLIIVLESFCTLVPLTPLPSKIANKSVLESASEPFCNKRSGLV